MRESPIAIFRALPRSDAEDRDFSGLEPERIARYCQRVREATPEARRRMLNPLIQLDYATCDEPTIQLVEDTLFLGILGQERPRGN